MNKKFNFKDWILFNEFSSDCRSRIPIQNAFSPIEFPPASAGGRGRDNKKSKLALAKCLIRMKKITF